MNALLQGLLADLLQRCERLSQEIQRITTLPRVVRDYRDAVTKQLSDVISRIRSIQKDPDIDESSLAKNFLRDYKRLAEVVRILEGGPVLALSRFSDQDLLLTMISHKIASEINSPKAPPLCAALSSHHYWTNPATNIIMVPAVEPLHLLGLSDLYHEIGHIILARNKLLDAFNADIDRFFQVEIKKVEKEGKPKDYKDVLKISATIWKKNWAIEFAADMIAAYLAGPAFGWANIRLCINTSNDLFASSSEIYYEHPADDARNEAICAMLEVIGVEKPTITGIQGMWNRFIALSGDSKPQDYELRFPPQLIANLSCYIYDRCSELRLKDYAHQKLNRCDANFACLLNTAWDNFNKFPKNFPEWELQQLKKIKESFLA